MLKIPVIILAYAFELLGRCFHALGGFFMDIAIAMLGSVSDREKE